MEFKKMVDFFLEQFLIHRKTEQKVHRIPIYSLTPPLTNF